MKNYVIRKNRRWTFVKIYTVLILFILLYLFIRFFALKIFHFTPDLKQLILNVLLIIFVILTAFYAIRTYLIYKDDFFILKSKEIIRRHGILVPRYESYLYSQFETIRYKQSSFGQRFNYGTIIIKVSIHDDIIELSEISNPRKTVEIIKKYIKNC